MIVASTGAARPRCEGVGASLRRDNGEQITVWGRERVFMNTAVEYRVMADKCLKWARNT